MGNFFTNFWDAFTHPISTIGGAIKANNNKDQWKDVLGEDYTWEADDLIDYFRDGSLPNGVATSASSGLDPTGYDQAEWDLEKTKELLDEQRAYNSAEAAKQRAWEENMSNTAYQRATQDLEKAGLNKWLAVTGGGNGASASTPTGASASSSAGDASTPNPVVFKSLLSALTSIFGTAAKIASK